MADTLSIIVRARDLATRTLQGVQNAAKDTKTAFDRIKMPLIWTSVGVALLRGIQAIREWKNEYVAAMLAAGRAELRFAEQMRAARKAEAGLIERAAQARIKAAGAAAQEAATTPDGRQQARNDMEMQALEAKHAAERKAHDARMAELQAEQAGLVALQSKAAKTQQEYEGAAGAAEIALARAKQSLGIEQKYISLGSLTNDPEELDRRLAIVAEARKKVAAAEAQAAVATERNAEAKKALAEISNEVAVIESRIQTERENAGNLEVAQREEVEQQKRESMLETNRVAAELAREEAENYRILAEKAANAAKALAAARASPGGKPGGMTPEELRNAREQGFAGGLEGELKKMDREDARQKKLRDQALDRARRAEAQRATLSAGQRRLLSEEAARVGAIAMGQAAQQRDNLANQLDGSETGRSIREAAKFLVDLRKDLRENLRGSP